MVLKLWAGAKASPFLCGSRYATLMPHSGKHVVNRRMVAHMVQGFIAVNERAVAFILAITDSVPVKAPLLLVEL